MQCIEESTALKEIANEKFGKKLYNIVLTDDVFVGERLIMTHDLPGG